MPRAPSAMNATSQRQSPPPRDGAGASRLIRSEASCDESSSGMPGLLKLSLQRRQPLLAFRLIVFTELLRICGRQAALQTRGRFARGLQRLLVSVLGRFSVECAPQLLRRVDALLRLFHRILLGRLDLGSGGGFGVDDFLI